MGDVVILHPQNTPIMNSHRRTIKFNHNHKSSPTNYPSQKSQTPSKSVLKNRINTDQASQNNNNMVMGHVKLLKRGQALQDLKHFTISNGPENSDVLSENKKPVKNTSKDKKIFDTNCSRSKVEVLKRQEEEDGNISSTRRLGPDPEVLSKKISECFAGSVFSDSPSPSSVPLPGFFSKNSVVPVNDDHATVNLQRILGLSL